MLILIKKGLWSDLESHILSEHKNDDTCNACGQTGVWNILEHYHEHHDGFASVIAETEIKCAGDGVTAEWFETVLSTKARFLASEVKPEKEAVEEAVVEDNSHIDILDTAILYKNTDDQKLPKISAVTSRPIAPAPIPKHPPAPENKKWEVKKVPRTVNCSIGITSEAERNDYNVECYRHSC